MRKLHMDIYTNYFTIVVLDTNIEWILNVLTRPLIIKEYGYNKYTKRMECTGTKEYFTAKGLEYRFPRGYLTNAISILYSYGIKKENITYTLYAVNNRTRLKAKLSRKIRLREYQESVRDTIVNNKSIKSWLIDMAPGTGKSLTSIATAIMLDKKVLYLLLPKYIDKWLEEIPTYCNISKEEIYVVQGNSSLNKLFKDNKHNYKIYLFSIPTIISYINNYEDNPLDPKITPTALMEHLDIGTIVSDETHQHFHAITKILTYFTADTTIFMSATFNTNNKQLANIYKLIIPPNHRISNVVKYVPYKVINAIEYNINKPNRIYHTTNMGYSHILFEQCILRHSLLRMDYYNLIKKYVIRDYINRKKDGDRLLIFVSTVKMCSFIVDLLNKDFGKDTSSNLSISTYVAEDEYETLITSDIAVSTLGSSGTGVDIPNLITCIQTVAITSLQANIQAIGRLRRIPNKEMVYTYLYCGNLDKHVKMHISRKQQIEYEAIRYNVEHYNKELRN